MTSDTEIRDAVVEELHEAVRSIEMVGIRPRHVREEAQALPGGVQLVQQIDGVVPRLEVRRHRGDECADGPYAAFWGCEAESELIG